MDSVIRMPNLSFYSSLDEVADTTDDELRSGVGFLDPEIVLKYMLYVRGELERLGERAFSSNDRF